MKKESLDDELKGLSPLLRDLKRQDDGFRLPEGYFGAVEDSVFSRVEATDMRRKPQMRAKRGGWFARFSRSQVLWATAAALALLLAATWLFRTPPAQTDTLPVATAQELTEEEIEAYVLENIRDFDADLLADVPATGLTLPETNPATPAEAKPKSSDPLDDLSDEELELLLKEMSDEELENLLKT